MLTERDYTRLKGIAPQLVAVVAVASTLTRQPFNVSEGLRTMERHRQLVAEGKSKTMQSKHLTGEAVDIYPLTYDKKAVDWQGFEELAKAMKLAASKCGVNVEWGGDWKSFVDKPHWQI